MKLVRNRIGELVPDPPPPEPPIYEAVMYCTEHDFEIEEYHAAASAKLVCPECGYTNWIDTCVFPVEVRRKLFGDCRQRLIDLGCLSMQRRDQEFERSVEEYDLFADDEDDEDE